MRLQRFVKVLVVNVLVFFVLFILSELLYRIHIDGLSRAFVNIFSGVPFSNLGTHNWIISDPVLGYRLNPETDKINSLSIRNEEIIIPKPEGLFRFIYLGDSIPWDDPGFVNYTTEALVEEGNIEVINASTPGYTTYQELMFLKTYLLDISPDLVVLTYCVNDNHKFLHRFNEKADMLLTREAEQSLKVTSTFDKVNSHSYLFTRLKVHIQSRQQHGSSRFPWDNMPDMHIAWKDDPWINFEKYLVEMKNILSKRDSKFAIVVFPFEPQLIEDYLKVDYNYVIKPQKVLKRLCDKHNIPCLDLFKAFYSKQSHGIKLFRDGLHLNKDGHELAAEKITEFLKESALLP